MKSGLFSGGDGNPCAVRQDKLGVGVLLYIVEIDDERLMYLIEEQWGHFFVQLIERTANRIAFVFGLQNNLSIGSGDVENVVNEHPLLGGVPVEEDVHIRPVVYSMALSSPE